MSANVSNSKLPLKEVLKPTGFRPPEDVKDLTFSEAMNSDNPSLEDNKAVSITSSETVITPSSGKDAMKKVTATVVTETKDVTIDVSTYIEPITITPSSGKAGISSIKITLTSI